MDRPFISCCRPWLPKLHKSLRVLLRHMVSGYRESIAQAEGARGHGLDEAGRPVSNAMVRLMVDQSPGPPMSMMGPWNQFRTDTSGKFTMNNVTNGTYTLLAAAPAVISGPADGRGGAGVGGFTSFGISGGVAGGTL